MSTTSKWAVRLPAIAVVVATLTFRTSAAAQTSAAAGKSFLWKVHAGTKVLYLAGSVHALGADAYPLSAAYENAFAAAGTLVEEINLAEAEQLALGADAARQGHVHRWPDVRGRRRRRRPPTLVASRLKEHGHSAGDDPDDEAVDGHADDHGASKRRRRDSTPRSDWTSISSTRRAPQASRWWRSRRRSRRSIASTQMPESLQEQMLRSTLTELDVQREQRGGDDWRLAAG